jgi:hypothetical protein
MLLEQVVHNVESKLVRIGQRLWADPQALFEEQGERLRSELKRQRAVLERQQAELAAAQDRLRENENAVGSLPLRIDRCIRNGQGPEAWQMALRLDEARQQLVADRVAVPRLEQVCWSLHFRIRQLERRLAAVLKQKCPS